MIEFHADDYGMFPYSSKRIIRCINEGLVNGISLMPNGQCLDECMELFKETCLKKTRLSIHLNIMTERPLSHPEEIPDLVDEQGFFNVTYHKLISAYLKPGLMGRLKRQIKIELSRQIDRCLPYLPLGEGIRIDSHRHFHMVPFVFDVIMELIDEKGLELSYIRIIREKPAFYRGIMRFEHFKPLNVIKVALLNAFSLADRLRHRDIYENRSADFASILFSGCMTERNLRLILKNIKENPSAIREDVELMFHPGAVKEPEDLKRIMDLEDRAYMSDPLRTKEAKALKASPSGGARRPVDACSVPTGAKRRRCQRS